jgi:GT2 family glycosyltransferase
VRISFVIPVFNQVEHTRACLAALDAHLPTDLAHEIILVNDGSDEDTRTFLDNLDASRQVIHLPQNQGFATATNTGAAQATGQWLCLLNNDVEITAGSIESLLAAAEAEPTAGIIGNVQVSSLTGEIDHAGISFVDSGYPLHRQPTLEQLRAEPDIVRVPAVTAACCLVNRAWFAYTGGLDTRYRNGFEDVDLCLRARDAGWSVIVAHRSLVRHAVSTSEGRGRHEYRNARQFLERWGPRALAYQHAEADHAAAAWRAQRATASASPATVRAARDRQRQEAAAQAARNARPAIVWIDLLRMEPRGANGGIKPLIYELLGEMTRLSWEPLQLVLLVQPGLVEEITFLGKHDVIAAREDGDWRIGSTILAADELERRHPPEVLYSPFGNSSFSRPGLPQVALLVDALHRDLPSALPIEEVNFREDNFQRIIATATTIQTLAEHGIARLQKHYGVHPTRCFHTYAAVQDRLQLGAPPAERPPELPTGPFFFYPANFWPHKNHEVLLAAYHRYRHEAGDDAWPLLLTGHPDARRDHLVTLRDALGLTDCVDFAGHLSNEAFRHVWHFAGALVFPSLHEGFGIPLVEAFAAGLPVIASRASVLPEVGGDACVWVDPRDPRDVAAMLAAIANDPARRAELAEAGRQRLARFSLHYEASKLNHALHTAARGLAL